MGRAGEKFAGNYVGLNRGNFPAFDAQVSPRLPPLTNADVIRETQLIVLSMPIKLCAEQQGGSPRAVQSQREGESAMSLRAAANLSRANPRQRARFARLFGFTGPHTDPEFMEAIEKVANYYWEKQQRQLVDVTPVNDPDQGDLFGGQQ